ncbi:Phosphate ABC transporter, permease protein PstA [uncultured Alphaproteobacteria bacterium]|uniref:Phosphate transport system permease protein PstA n=1 Tax=uncultured Alphaproteobacteria bacterium TaxID=91750 RepID=A0A212KLN7_9PROT|nr:Phosphate ABC transporter, permease protein PstA [uncultured Alphaproteobacteria bacterium]
MSEMTVPTAAGGRRTRDLVAAGIGRRYRAEKRFRLFGLVAIVSALAFMALLFASIVGKGYSAFLQTEIRIPIAYEVSVIDPDGTRDAAAMMRANYGKLYRDGIQKLFPAVETRQERRVLNGLVSSGAAFEIRDAVMDDPSLIGKTGEIWVPASDDVDMLVKGKIDRRLPETARRVTDAEIAWIDALDADGRLDARFNWRFFTQGDSREPELAGIWGAVAGSFLTMIVTLLLSFPLGVATAVYLEEFAPKNRWTDIIEVNINNLAAIPSIVFGLLGLAVFLQFFGLPRSAPLVGGLVLTLMTLPTIIIAARVALKSVPPSIREAALGLGASKMQMVTNDVLPLAMPGILTGTIIGMGRALGETAPLLMIGMVAFIVDIPGGFRDPATVLPVQIYIWADSAERAFVERTSAAIMVLLTFLILMNAAAVYLRGKFERRW